MTEPKYDSTADTLKHSLRVGALMGQAIAELVERSTKHDLSKTEPPELEIFNEFTPKLKGSTYGSEEYKGFLEAMGEALRHHYAHNRHHPEHFGARGISAMTLIDLIEMLSDWKAATERHDDGDLARSLEIQRERFGISDQLAEILQNTAAHFGWITELAIDVHADALRLRVADHGEWFSTRTQGREVWKAAIGLFADNEHADSMVLDFDGVQAITTTCADEMVAGLITRQDDRRIVVAGTSDQIADAITTALARRGLAVEGIGEKVFFAALAAREQELCDLRSRLGEADDTIGRAWDLVDDMRAESPQASSWADRLSVALSEQTGDADD